MPNFGDVDLSQRPEAARGPRDDEDEFGDFNQAEQNAPDTQPGNREQKKFNANKTIS